MSNNAPRGALAAATAFFIWGLFPLYWKLLGAVACPSRHLVRGCRVGRPAGAA
ncbi:MAG: hypothetical protein WDO12_02125 [Pseudomonadota bacterium]